MIPGQFWIAIRIFPLFFLPRLSLLLFRVFPMLSFRVGASTFMCVLTPWCSLDNSLLSMLSSASYVLSPFLRPGDMKTPYLGPGYAVAPLPPIPVDGAVAIEGYHPSRSIPQHSRSTDSCPVKQLEEVHAQLAGSP